MVTGPDPLTRALAHGVGGRGDLPIPFGAALVGAVVALLVSFAVLAWRWPRPRIGGGTAGRPLAAGLASLLDAGWWTWLWRLVGLAAVAYTCVAAFGGPDDALNPTAGVAYVLFWVGVLVVASLLLGPVWRALNPLRTLHALLSALLRRDPRAGLVGRYPAGLGYWPAAVSLLCFVWLELVGPDRDSTLTLRWWFGGYAAVHLLGGICFGSQWFSRADGFEVLSAMYGRLSVLGRRDDGVRVLRSPLAGLDQLRGEPGLVALAAVMLGSTAYDGVTQGLWWVSVQQGSTLPRLASGSLGLLVVVGLVAGTFAFAARAAGWLSGTPGYGLATRFAPSLVPIAAGYALAHYWSLLVLVGQQTVLALSDPLGRGSDVFGIGDRGISYALVGPTATSTLQVLFVVTGHVVGIVIAHDRATRVLPARHVVRGQLPLLGVMVGYTLVGLLLLFSG